MSTVPTTRRPIAWNLVRNGFGWTSFALALLVLGAVQVVWALLAPILWYCLPADRGRVIGRYVISFVFRRFFVLTALLGVLRVEAEALDALDPDESMILAPNHPSVLDALILISRLDNLNCIMKASVLDNFLLGAGARLAGYVRNDGPRRMLRLASEELKRGGQLIIFPEGTRTVAAPVNEFKGGFAAIARIAKVPVQTVIIETDTPFLSKGWSVLKKPDRLPMTFRVRLGRRFEVGHDLHAFLDELRTYYEHELADAQLGDLRERPRPLSVGEPDVASDEGDDDCEGVGVTAAWRPARSRSATPW